MADAALPSWSTALARAVLRRLEPYDDPRPLALLRISLGLLTLVHVASLWPLADFLFADDGLLPPAEICGKPAARLSLLCHLPGSAVPAYFVAFGVVALAFTLGVATRVTAVLTTVGFAAFVLRNSVYAAGDQVFANFLFLSCLSRCGEAWSVDAWWRARRRPGARPRRIPAWPRMLMIVQLCVMFGANGWNKHGPGWIEGDAFAYMLMNDRWFRVPAWGLVSHAEPLLRAGSWAVWWFERLFPLVGIAAAARAVIEVRDASGATPSSRVGRAVRWVLWRPLGVWPWLAMSAVFLGTLVVLLNLGWFVPASLVVGVCLLPRLPRTSPWPDPAPRPVAAGPRARLRWAAVLVLMAWHSLAMVQGSMPVLTKATPAALARPLETWRRVTHTSQPWRMFSRGAPRKASYLHAVGIGADGTETRIASPLDWHVDPRHPYVGHERRRKVAARIVSVETWQQRYARWLCRTARDPDGRPFAAVALDEVLQPLPAPRWMAEHGPVDPYERFADHRTTRRLTERGCPASDG